LFATGVTSEALAEADVTLGAALPASLRELLLDSDGITVDEGIQIVWSLRRIVADNLTFRSGALFRGSYMPFDSLMFFGDEGNGDQYGFVVLEGAVSRRDVFRWDHESDSRICVASGLESHLEALARRYRTWKVQL
jgi:hypothetical protein